MKFVSMLCSVIEFRADGYQVIFSLPGSSYPLFCSLSLLYHERDRSMGVRLLRAVRFGANYSANMISIL